MTNNQAILIIFAIMKIKISILIILCFLSTQITLGQKTGTLFIEITAFRNDVGVVAVALFDAEEGFPGSEENMVKATTTEIKKGKATLQFNDLTFGEYAISAFHDENKNGKIDTNWLGIPKEGVGASNNAKGKMGPPKYKDAKFQFSSDQQKMKFEIDYIF